MLEEGIFDIHCHIVPGVDDGAADIEETRKLLEMEYKQGVRNIILTPHFRFRMFETPLEKVQRQFRLSEEAAADISKDLHLYLGCEFHANMEMLPMLREKKVNEELLIKLDSTGDYLKRARNTYNLVGLGNLPMGKDRDRRFGQRNTAYQKALNSLEHWNHMKDLSKEYQNDMKNQIIMTALGDGFFSIWMEVFCDEPEIRLALIEAFPGTNLNYYDEKGCVKEII